MEKLTDHSAREKHFHIPSQSSEHKHGHDCKLAWKALNLAHTAMTKLTDDLLPSLEDRLWNRTAACQRRNESDTVFLTYDGLTHMCVVRLLGSKDSDLVFAIGAILKGMPTVRQQ